MAGRVLLTEVATEPIQRLRARRMLVSGEIIAAEISIADGRIAGVVPIAGAADHATTGLVELPDDVIVLPGNVDTHVHINEPGRTHWEGFASATAAAVRGGVTTVVDMPLNSIPPTVDVPALELKRASAENRIACDVGFWGGVVPGNTEQLEPLWDAGVFGFKCFLSPSGVDEFPHVDAPTLHAAMTAIAAFDGLLIVHAEDAATLAAIDARPSAAYIDFVHSRPERAELAAIETLIAATRATGARTHVLHLSSARALDLLADARAEGLPITVETCPHYLCFESGSIPAGAAEFKCCPPIRDEGNRSALWDGLQAGIIDCIVSDHSPAGAEEKYRGAPDLQQAWGGIAGLQVGFSAVAAAAQQRGIGVDQVSRWMAAEPARIARVPARGAIAPGFDADLAIYAPDRPQTVVAADLQHRHPISAYDGMRLPGTVVGTVLRGALVYGGPDNDPAVSGVLLDGPGVNDNGR